MASRILGMGDVLTLVERAEAAIEEDEKEELERRMMQGEFSFDDFLKSFKMLQRMGPLQGVLKMIPGMGKQLEGSTRSTTPAEARRGDRPLDDAARAPRPARHRRPRAASASPPARARPSSTSTSSSRHASRWRR
jgi:signal recognition particle subunit SRP54